MEAARGKTRVSLLVLYSKNRKKASRNAEKNAFSPKKSRSAALSGEMQVGCMHVEAWKNEGIKRVFRTHAASVKAPRFH
jgi:hypothetical protein